MDSSGLVSATTSSRGATTVVVGPGPESRVSDGGEAGGTSCREDEVGRAALIEMFARERSLVDCITNTYHL